jgi:DNA-directed RNA polymerase specialized sigma24 family protein
MATLPECVTEADVRRVLRIAHSIAERRARKVPALIEVATDAATDAVVWALQRYTPDRGPFDSFALAAARKFIWRAIEREAIQFAAGRRHVELNEDTVTAPTRSSHDDGRDVQLPESVRELPPDLRDTVRFFFLDRYDIRDCGLLLGCGHETVRARLKRAAELLADDQRVHRPHTAGRRRMRR